MPALGAAVAAQLTFGGAVALGAGIAIHAGVFVAMTAVQKRQLSRDQGRVPMPPRDVMIKATVEHRRIVYGEAACSGMLFFLNTVDPSAVSSDLYLGVVHCGHQVDEFLGFYIDDRYVPIADIEAFPGDDGEVSDNTGSHGYGPVTATPILWLRGHLGEDAQTADSFLTSAFGSYWTSDHRLRGNAYTLARLRQINDLTDIVWEGYPQTIQAKFRGKLVYDPRLDSTQAGGSGAHRVNDSTTWEWSNNPVLCTRDYMVDAKLGMGKHCDYTLFDYAHIAAQADLCDELVDIPGSTTQPRYACNGVLNCGMAHEDNLIALHATMNGRPAFKNGKHYLFAGEWETPIATLTERHLAGDIDFRPQPDSDERYNQVRGVYYDESRQDKQGEFLPVNDTAIRSSRDNGKTKPRDLNLSLVTNEHQAQRLAFKILYQDADTGLATIRCNAAALRFEIGDPIALTIARFQWVAKPWRIVGMRVQSYDVVELDLREYNQSSYDDPDAGDYGTRSAAGAITFPKDLPQKLRTPYIAPEAVAAVVEDSAINWSVGTFSGSGGAFDEAVVTATYVNTSAEPQTLVGEVSAQLVSVDWNFAVPATRRLYYQYSSSSSGSGSEDMLNPVPGDLGEIPVSATAMVTVNLDPGDTLTLELMSNLIHDHAAHMSGSVAIARLIAVKR